ncbi:MAG: TerC family protein [Alphaproteobacteria bacterium]
MEMLTTPEFWASLLTLTALEIVLGIDNLVFLSVVTGRLPEAQRQRATRIGLIGALGLRVVFLSMIVWIAGLVTPVFSIGEHAVSWRDIILLAGGLFLLAKGTIEIHHTVEGEQENTNGTIAATAFTAAIIQIIALDIVFSLDSVITAIGMTDNLPVMITAVCIAIGVMMFAARPVGEFVEKHPTTKMLALSFLLLIGVALVADGLHFHIPREYLYFAIAFSVSVEALNLLAKRNRRKKNQA